MKKKCLALLAAAVCLFSACSSGSNELLSIGGKPISEGEYRLYLVESENYVESLGGEEVWDMTYEGGVTAAELAKERALNSLKTVRLACKRAEKMGITLSATEEAAAVENGQALWDSFSQEVRDYVGLEVEGYAQVFRDTALYEKVYQTMIEEVTPTEEEIESFYESNKTMYREVATMVTLSSILTADEERAGAAVAELIGGTPFAQVSALYEVEAAEVENEGEITAYVGQLQDELGWDLRGCNPGDLFGPMETPEGWYVLQVKSVEAPVEDEVRSYAASYYVSSLQTSAFEMALEAWNEDTPFEYDADRLAEIPLFVELNK